VQSKGEVLKRKLKTIYEKQHGASVAPVAAAVPPPVIPAASPGAADPSTYERMEKNHPVKGTVSRETGLNFP
jgi:hypothetical protein